MSGAFGALGGELSAISINPAGSAIYNKGVASLSFSSNVKQNDTDLQNNINNNVMQSNISKKSNENLIKESIGLLQTKGLTPEYLKICDPDTLEDLNHFSGRALIAIAMKLGDVRLIDNILID